MTVSHLTLILESQSCHLYPILISHMYPIYHPPSYTKVLFLVSMLSSSVFFSDLLSVSVFSTPFTFRLVGEGALTLLALGLLTGMDFKFDKALLRSQLVQNRRCLDL